MCTDTDGEMTDDLGDGCHYYDQHPEECGDSDDADFTASKLCCACGGGKKGNLTLFQIGKYHNKSL